MIVAGPVLTQLYKSLKASDAGDKKAALGYFNLAYFDIARRLSWQELRRSRTITFDGTTPAVLPSNLAGIDGLYDTTRKRIFGRREKSQTAIRSDASDRYYIDGVTNAALLYVAGDGAGVTVANGATAATYNPALSKSYAGEFMVIEDRLGFYELDANNNLVEPLMDEAVDQAWFQIRPRGTQQMMAVNCDGSPFVGSLVLDYWTLPTPIFDGSQVINLPTSDALLTKTRCDYFQLENIDYKAANELLKRLPQLDAAMESANPAYLAPAVPENRFGQKRSMWGAQ